MNSVSVDRNIANGFEESHFRCNSAKVGRSRTFWGSNTGIDPPLRLLISALSPVTYSLGEIHNLEAFGADDRELVLQKMDVEGFGGNEKVLVQPEPLRPLPKERSEWSTLPIFGVAPKDRLENPKEGVHLIPLAEASQHRESRHTPFFFM